MVFANPNYLYLLLLLIPMIGYYIYKLRKSQASLRVSSSEPFKVAGGTSLLVYMRHLPFVLRTLAVALLIVILARPQSTDNWSSSSTEGIDIMLAMDISGSMLAQDLKPNRLEAAGEFHAMPLDNGSYRVVEPVQGYPEWNDSGWYGYWLGIGECRQPCERQQG